MYMITKPDGAKIFISPRWPDEVALLKFLEREGLLRPEVKIEKVETTRYL